MRKTHLKAALLLSLSFILLMVLETTALASGLGTIETKAKTIIGDIYKFIAIISTGLAVVAASTSMLISKMSRSQKTIDECKQWLKRIIFCWAGINGIGLIVTALSGYFGANSGTQWTP